MSGQEGGASGASPDGSVMMGADELRKAAERLREMAGRTAWDAEGWWSLDGLARAAEGASAEYVLVADAAWISLLSPQLGRSLADWLDDAAGKHDAWVEQHGSQDVADRIEFEALNVARLINGGAE